MIVKWTNEALLDLVRFQEFLADAPVAAAKVVQELTSVDVRLLAFPRIGVRLPQYAPAEVRKVFVGQYEVRYEIIEDVIVILHIWHTREDR